MVSFKFLISLVLLRAMKWQTTFWDWQDYGYFVIIVAYKNIAKSAISEVKDCFVVINQFILFWVV